MDELLGLIDSLEATILDSKKIPMTDKCILEEQQILQLVDKIRMTLKSGESLARQSVDLSQEDDSVNNESIDKVKDEDADAVLRDSLREADEIKQGAQEYAEYILANLHLMVTKMQKNLIKVEKNLESGRDLLDQKKEKD